MRVILQLKLTDNINLGGDGAFETEKVVAKHDLS